MLKDDYCPCGCGNSIVPGIAKEHEGVLFNGIHCIRRYLATENTQQSENVQIAK